MDTAEVYSLARCAFCRAFVLGLTWHWPLLCITYQRYILRIQWLFPLFIWALLLFHGIFRSSFQSYFPQSPIYIDTIYLGITLHYGITFARFSFIWVLCFCVQLKPFELIHGHFFLSCDCVESMPRYYLTLKKDVNANGSIYVLYIWR